MTRLPRYLAFFAALVSILIAFSRPARADAAAQALFNDAKKLMAAGKFDEACPKFEESQRLAPAIGTQYNLAACYEAQGKIASAWSLYLDVAGLAKSTNQPDREKVARANAAALEGKLSRLNITVEKAPPDIEVRRDGAVIGKAQWGTAIPVDPGAHKVTAVAPGKKPWETTVTIEPGEAEKAVAVPELEAGPPAPRYSGPGVPPPYYSNDPNQGPPKPKTKRRSVGMMAGGIVAMSLGTLSALGGGAVLVSDRNNGGAGAGFLVTGLLLMGGGITLTVIGAKKIPADEPPPPAAAFVPDFTISPTAASLRWSF